MIYHTYSGSVYEVDGNRVRRLHGVKPPTDRVGEGWKECVGTAVVDGCLVILWDHTGKATVTSPVVTVGELC